MGDTETQEEADVEVPDEEQQEADADAGLTASPVLSKARRYDPETDAELAEMLMSAVDMAVSILR
jgi:hypothetical protein